MRFAAKTLVVTAALALALAGTGCAKKDAAAVVNGETIKNTEVEFQLEQIKKQYPDLFKSADGEAREADFRQRIIDNLINVILIKQAAEKEGVKVSEKELEENFKTLRKNFPDQKAFEDALEKAGLDEAKLRDQLRSQALTQGLIEKLAKKIKVTDAEIKKYYEDNKAQFKEKAGTHAWHIQFDKKDKATAQKVLGQVKAGENFGELAKKYSKDAASASKGGDLGWPQVALPQAFQSAMDKLALGGVSELVETEAGWHIIKVIERREERLRSYDEVKEQIRELVRQQKQAQVFNDYVEKLRKQADIERLGEEAAKKEASGKDAK